MENETKLDRIQLKEERKIRNKLKKEAKKLEKQKNREQMELLKLQPKSSNVVLVSRDFADKVVGNNSGLSHKQDYIDHSEFPELKASGTKLKRRTQLSNPFVDVDSDKNKFSKLELADFIVNNASSSTTLKPKKSVPTPENYSGNPLDSDMPIRKRGKHRETPKTKHVSKLKQNILNEQSLCEQDSSIKSVSILLDTEICNNIITEELNDAAKTFISGVVGLQEKLYARDPIKGVAKRRYVLGLHETRKYLKLNKAKMLIIAPDIKLVKPDGALFCTVKEIIDLAKANNVTYVFALKRKLLGILALKYIPISCVLVLNYEGLEEQLRNLLKILPTVRKEDQSARLTTVENDANMKFLNNLMEALKTK